MSVAQSDRLLAAQLTPAGRGAIGVIGVRGSQADSCVADAFTPVSGHKILDLPVGRILLGRWKSERADAGRTAQGQVDSSLEEELVVCRVASDAWEIHCHGGQAAAEAILHSLARKNCDVVDWTVFLNLPSNTGRHARQAWIDLPRAKTERVATLLLDQARGALDDAWPSIERAMNADPVNIASVLQRVEELLKRSAWGRFLLTPRQIVLAGRPNVGKSSLLNALVGFERALVAPQAGTTRDVVGVSAVIDGWPVELRDTAGVRVTSETLEAEGVTRSCREWQRADLRVLVLEAANEAGMGEHLETLGSPAPDLIVWNKADLCSAWSAPAGTCLVSARTGQGIDGLLERLAKILTPSDLTAGMAIPWTAEQASELRDLRRRIMGAAEDSPARDATRA